jgi:arsenite methyltransferase
MKELDIKKHVKQRYAAVARDGGCGCDSVCCSDENQTVTPLIDYGELILDIVPEADLGLGCGIPTQNAGIKKGDTVLDLGSGAGVDVFLAAKAVGKQGMVIGVDMTPEMIAKAWNNAVKGGFDNVEFRMGDIEDLPVSSGSVNVVISNCVINLVPDKKRVFAEIYRVLKSGGHFTISDMVTYGKVPESIRENMELWAGCISGALDRDEYVEIIRQSGFGEIFIKNFSEYDAFKGDDYGIASITIEAYKA